MRLQQILFSQGFGSRRECDGLIRNGLVRLGERVLLDSQQELELTGLVLQVERLDWACHARAVVLLHKPPGYECSRQPRHHPSVLSLLPPPLRRRGVQPVGRLDADTTGLLLLTDDGALIHRLTHPRRHVAKVYEVSTAHPVDAEQLRALLAGVSLHDDPAPARATACVATGSHALRLSLTEGRYHQVKRMLGAVGNRVVALHRSAYGGLALPADLAPGQWRWLPDQALELISPAVAEPAASG